MRYVIGPRARNAARVTFDTWILLEYERSQAYSLVVTPYALMQRRGLVIGLVERRILHRT